VDPSVPLFPSAICALFPVICITSALLVNDVLVSLIENAISFFKWL
jgi:hypothetical protein